MGQNYWVHICIFLGGVQSVSLDFTKTLSHSDFLRALDSNCVGIRCQLPLSRVVSTLLLNPVLWEGRAGALCERLALCVRWQHSRPCPRRSLFCARTAPCLSLSRFPCSSACAGLPHGGRTTWGSGLGALGTAEFPCACRRTSEAPRGIVAVAPASAHGCSASLPPRTPLLFRLRFGRACGSVGKARARGGPGSGRGAFEG